MKRFSVKKGNCQEEGCSYFGVLRRGRCGYHYSKFLKEKSSGRSHAKAGPEDMASKSPAKKQIQPKKKSALQELGNPGFNNLFELYMHIWESRPHKSELTGIPLTEFNISMFAHLAAKGRYKELKWNVNNIVLLTPYEHHLLDHGTIKQRELYANEQKKIGRSCDWNGLNVKKELLINTLSSTSPGKR